MAPIQQVYPRSTVRRVVKTHSAKNVSKNVDVLVFLNYTIFLHDLLREASIDAKRKGHKGLTPRSIRKVTENCLRKFKG